MLSLPEAETGGDTVRFASYAALPLFALGIIGNGIMMRLMIKLEVRQYSSSIFLFCLAITDTIVLIFEIMDDIAIHIPDYSAYTILFGYNRWRCRFGVFFYQTARTVSAWLVVAMAAELCMAVNSHRRRKLVYYRNRTLYVAMAIVLVAIAAGFPFLVLTQDDRPDAEMPSCTSLYEVFFLVYSEFVLKGATHFVFPVIFIVVCNLITLYMMAREKPLKDRFRTASDTDRRGASLKTKVQAINTIYAISILYILSVSPATVAELMIMIQRFFADFGYTWEWSVAINATGVIFLANYAMKFYLIVLFGKDYRAAFAGKMPEWSLEEEPEANGQISNGVANGVANGVYSYGVMRHTDIRLDER